MISVRDMRKYIVEKKEKNFQVEKYETTEEEKATDCFA
jgi:hypothetical protein